MTRFLIIPLKKGDIFDDECKETLILAPTRNQANRHIKYTISKKFDRWEVIPIETSFSYSRG